MEKEADVDFIEGPTTTDDRPEREDERRMSPSTECTPRSCS